MVKYIASNKKMVNFAKHAFKVKHGTFNSIV